MAAIVIDGSQTNRKATISYDTENRPRDLSRRSSKPIRIRRSRYLNNRIEQYHPSHQAASAAELGFKAFSTATVTLGGIKMAHMMRKRQSRFAFNSRPLLKQQFEAIA